MSSWLKLLLLTLVALVLPWDGIRYARQMESALRTSERHTLSSIAATLAASLQGRTELLYRYPGPLRSGPYDLTPVLLRSPLYVDDYSQEWPRDRRAWRYYGNALHRFGILTGVEGRMLYVLMKVRDPHLVFDSPPAKPLRSSSMGDRVWLGYADSRGRQHAEFFALTGAGPIVARRIETGEYGRKRAIVDPRIIGALRPEAGGYDLEFSMPLSLTNGRFGVLIDDRDRRGAAPVSYGTLRTSDLHTRGRLILASPALPAYLARFVKPGLRLVVTTPGGAMLAQADELAVPQVPAPEPGLLARLYARLVGPRGIRLTRVQVPIHGLKPATVIATLRVTQSSHRGARLRNHTLERMLSLTLATSCAALLAAIALAAQLLMSAWRGHRRRRAAGRGDH